MAVDSGMDVERMRSIAQQLMGQGDKIGAVASSGRAQMGVLDGVWSGGDVTAFSGRWDGAERAAHNASSTLRTFGERMLQQADDQQEASDGIGGASGSGVGGQGGGQGPSLADTLKALLGSSVVTAFKTLKKGWGAVTGLLGFAKFLGGKGSWLSQFTFLSKFMSKDQAIAALGRIGPMTLAEAKAAGLAGWMSKLGRFGGMLRTAGGLLGKIAGPIGIVTGAMDIYEGIKNGDWLTGIQGGAGVVSGAALTALAFGGAALAGTAAAPFIIGAAVVGGAIWAGIEIWQNREAIWDGLKTAGGWVGDRLSDAGSAISDAAGDVKDAAGSVLGGIKDGLGSVFG